MRRFDVIEQVFFQLGDEPFRQAGMELFVKDEQVDVIGHDREFFDDGNLIVPLHGLEGLRRGHTPAGRLPYRLSLMVPDFPQGLLLLIRAEGDELAAGNRGKRSQPRGDGEKRSGIHGQHLQENKTFKTSCVVTSIVLVKYEKIIKKSEVWIKK